MKKTIKEIIVVEGKDDVSAVRCAVDATIVITNGMGLEDKRLKEIAAMAKKQGVIVLTDPDVPGTLIRNRITELVPNAKHAFISRKEARHPVTGRLGVEYASPEVILKALEKAYATTANDADRYTMSDLVRWGLVGRGDSKARRQAFCDLLHLGQANGKALLKRLNTFALEEDIILEALDQLETHHEPQ